MDFCEYFRMAGNFFKLLISLVGETLRLPNRFGPPPPMLNPWLQPCLNPFTTKEIAFTCLVLAAVCMMRLEQDIVLKVKIFKRNSS